ncbi:MAG: LLM class flavin-dependent oxidoreductase [Promethearchaeota archaeon]
MIKFGVSHSTSFSMQYYGRDEIIKSSKLLEELGNFDMSAVMDHLSWYPDTAEIYSGLMMAAEVIMNTQALSVGVLVTDVFRTHPVQIALHALHLQRMSGGRFILGLGAGEGPNLSAWGIDSSKPVSHLEEAIQVIKLLLTSGPKNKVTFNGKYFSFKKQYLQMQVDDPPKVWMAACSPRTLRITSKHADGWLPIGASPELYAEQAKIVKSEGRDITMAYNAYTSISKADPESARERMKYVGAVQCLRPEILKKNGIDVPEKVDFIKHFALPKVGAHKRHQGHAMEFAIKHEIPEDVLLSPVLAGSPEDIIEQIEAYIKAGCEYFCIQFFGPDYWNQVKLFSNEVISYFKEND